MANNYTKITSLFDNSLLDKEVSTRGWVYRIRKQKDYTFITLRDSSGIIQTVFSTTQETEKLTMESSVELSGLVKKDGRSPGGYELQGKTITPYHISEDFPIRKDFSTEFLNDVRHLWNRSQKLTTVMKLKAATLKYARDWFNQNGWYETTPPIINKSACEGGSTLFEVNYFDEKAYLSQSAQLYLESLIYSLEKVWSLTPSFRAEKSKTPRHLAEYWHLEGELAWGKFDDILQVEEQLVSYVCKNLAEKNYKELEFLKRNPENIKKVEAPFERIPYADVISFLNKKGCAIKFGDDLGTEEERLLTKDSDKPVFIYGAPISIKPFYTKRDPSDERMVLSADLIAPRGFGEITTGGQREENLESIVERIKKEGFNPVDYSWYLDLRRYGSVPHSGFGLGIERFVRWLCNLNHIRDAIPFPRTMKRAYP